MVLLSVIPEQVYYSLLHCCIMLHVALFELLTLRAIEATKFAIEMGFKEESLSTNHSRRLFEDWSANKCQPNFRKVSFLSSFISLPKVCNLTPFKRCAFSFFFFALIVLPNSYIFRLYFMFSCVSVLNPIYNFLEA